MGQRIEDDSKIEHEDVIYFSHIFQSQALLASVDDILVTRHLSYEDVQFLSMPISREEVINALKNMHPQKGLGQMECMPVVSKSIGKLLEMTLCLSIKSAQ